MTAPMEGTTTTAPLDEAMRRVRAARKAYAEVAERFAERKAEFAAAVAPLANLAKERAAAVEAEETQARALALEAFTATGDKRPAIGVEIKEKDASETLYPALDAFKWCKEKGICINPETLNVDAFESLIESLPESDRPTFVTIVEAKEPQVQFAKDMDAAFAKAGAA